MAPSDGFRGDVRGRAHPGSTFCRTVSRQRIDGPPFPSAPEQRINRMARRRRHSVGHAGGKRYRIGKQKCLGIQHEIQLTIQMLRPNLRDIADPGRRFIETPGVHEQFQQE